MRQKYYWKYFAFNQLHLAKGKISPVKIGLSLLAWAVRTGSD